MSDQFEAKIINNLMKTPQLPLEEVHAIIEANGIPRDRYPVVAVAIRGYYMDSMGQPGENDRRIYDDAHFIVWPDGIARFQGNTDPNGYRKGSGTGSGKGMAMLKDGIHLFGVGLHKGRPGFRQAESFTVIRDGNPPYEDKGYHALNWHDGGIISTSSLGCQTNPPDVFRTLRQLTYGLLDTYGNERGNTDNDKNVRTIPYILLEEKQRRAGNLIASLRYLSPPQN